MKKNIIISLILMFSIAEYKTEINMNNYRFPMKYRQVLENLEHKFSYKPVEKYIIVDTNKQKLYLIKEFEIIQEYSISTSKYGLGSRYGSYKTPTGYHRIVEKIGNGVPIGGIFKSKQFTGEMATIYTSKRDVTTDFITTRIMVIDGLEPGVNTGKGIDSRLRGIFIHGTQEEGLIGKPASNGCIRMKNFDVVDLFEKIDNGTYITII